MCMLRLFVLYGEPLMGYTGRMEMALPPVTTDHFRVRAVEILLHVVLLGSARARRTQQLDEAIVWEAELVHARWERRAHNNWTVRVYGRQC
jgi:hypothetical protein